MRSENNFPDQEILASFWDHIEELRKLIVSCLLVILAGSCLSFLFVDSLISLFSASLPEEIKQTGSLAHYALVAERVINTSSESLDYTFTDKVRSLSPGVKALGEQQYRLPPGEFVDIEKIKPAASLVVLSPLEGFTSALIVSLWASLLLTSPICIYLILKFIAPALKNEERQIILPLMVTSAILIGAGICCALFLTLPLTNRYFFQFNQAFGANLWGLSHYINYTLILLLGHGIAFQSGSLLFLLIHFQLVTSENLADKRRYAYVAILVFSAILTPPDVISQLIMAIPMIGFYELAILYGRMRKKSVIRPLA